MTTFQQDPRQGAMDGECVCGAKSCPQCGTPQYSGEPTQRADEVAADMRDFYEVNKPIRWWQKRRVWNDCRADDLMLGLLRIAQGITP